MPQRPKRAGRGGRVESSQNGERAQQAEQDGPPLEDPFDLWLRDKLFETFGAIAAEPVPETLLRMIEEDAGGNRQTRKRPGRHPASPRSRREG